MSPMEWCDGVSKFSTRGEKPATVLAPPTSELTRVAREKVADRDIVETM